MKSTFSFKILNDLMDILKTCFHFHLNFKAHEMLDFQKEKKYIYKEEIPSWKNIH